MWFDFHSSNASRAPAVCVKPSSHLGSPILYFECQARLDLQSFGDKLAVVKG